MAKKIFAWIWLLYGIYCTILWMMDPAKDYWFFVLVYFVGMIYIEIKYLESLK